VLAEAERRGIGDFADATDAVALPGRGVAATVDGAAVLVGTRALMDEKGVALPAVVAAAADRMAAEGATVLLVARDGAALGVLSVADAPRPEAAGTVADMKRLGLSPAMLTGDLAPVAAQVGAAVGVPAGDIGAQLLPEDKLRRVEGMARAGDGGAVFVGDGINDAPALAAATVGVAMGAGGTAAALEAADVALVESDLSRLPLAVRLARATRAVVRQNVVLALGTVAVLIFGTFVGRLPLWVGVLGHEGSALLVIANALRLLSPALTRVDR
jgi:Cd2+/Zn2+-exporting ATPase